MIPRQCSPIAAITRKASQMFQNLDNNDSAGTPR